MSASWLQPMPKLQTLPTALPLDNAVRIELQEGVPIFRASTAVQSRIEALLQKQRAAILTSSDEQELEQYEEMDDYLSFINRLVRNLVNATSSET